MKRTKENCSLIKQSVKLGIGEPETTKNGKCDGYETADGEPFKTCQKCKLCYWYEEEKWVDILI